MNGNFIVACEAVDAIGVYIAEDLTKSMELCVSMNDSAPA